MLNAIIHHSFGGNVNTKILYAERVNHEEAYVRQLVLVVLGAQIVGFWILQSSAEKRALTLLLSLPPYPLPNTFLFSQCTRLL